MLTINHAPSKRATKRFGDLEPLSLFEHLGSIYMKVYTENDNAVCLTEPGPLGGAVYVPQDAQVVERRGTLTIEPLATSGAAQVVLYGLLPAEVEILKDPVRGKIQAIKALRARLEETTNAGIGLKEAKEIVEAVERALPGANARW